MISKSFSTTTTLASRSQVWNLISDVDHWSDWDSSVQQSGLKGPFATGSSFILTPKGGPTVQIQLEEVRPGQYFRDKTRFPLAAMYGEHWYEDTPAGLRLTVTMTMRGPLSFLWNLLVMKGIVRNLEQDTLNLVAAAQKTPIHAT